MLNTGRTSSLFGIAEPLKSDRSQLKPGDDNQSTARDGELTDRQLVVFG